MNNFDYKNLTPFKWFVIENFPFIEGNFEAINNYRLFGKVVEYLNKVIDDMNAVGQQTENITNAMTNLQNYVNNYFDNLDVQDEINNKLDEMAIDGTLSSLMSVYIDNIINPSLNNLQNQINSLASGSPLVASSISEMTDTTRVYVNTTDGHWYYYNGTVWTDGGIYQSSGISDHSVTKVKINNDLFEEDAISFLNIDINSTTRNQFSRYITVNGQQQLDINLKGILETDLQTNGNIFRVQIRGANTLQTAGTTLGAFNFNIIPNGETEIELNETYDLSNYTYCNIVLTILVDNYNITNKNVVFKNENFSVNDEIPNIVEIFTPTTDVATYDFNYLITNTKTPITKDEVKAMINESNFNEIHVATVQELKNAIDSIATSPQNNKASYNNRYKIILASGTYELYNVLDLTDIQDQVLFKRGLEIPDYTDLVGIGNVEIKLTLPNNTDSTIVQAVSVLNTYGENHFENIKITANNCRYCVHDDDGGPYKDRIIEFKNCSFVHSGNTINAFGQCYGAGYTGGRIGIFENCNFTSTKISFYVHSSSEYYMTNKFFLYLNNCYFISDTSTSVDIHDPYSANNQGIIQINNSKLNNKLLLRGTNPFTVYGGGNNSFTINNQNNSDIYIVQ